MHTHTLRAVPIARLGQPVDHIVENVMKGMAGVTTKIPRGWKNIQVIHMKTVDSISLPVYNSLPPAPGILPPVEGVEEGPPRKRIKLEEVVKTTAISSSVEFANSPS